MWSIAAACSSLVRPSHLPRALIYVDPVDFERRILLGECEERGIECLQVWSPPYAQVLVEQGALSEEGAAVSCAPGDGDEAEWASDRLDGFDVLGVLCGSDAGLATAERLQHVLSPARSNGQAVARRNKYLMHEALRAAGLRAAAQCAPKDWAEAEAFLRTLPSPLRAVVKPVRGQDSLRVGLATSLEQARRMFDALRQARASLDDEVPAAPLLQEFLDG